MEGVRRRTRRCKAILVSLLSFTWHSGAAVETVKLTMSTHLPKGGIENFHHSSFSKTSLLILLRPFPNIPLEFIKPSETENSVLSNWDTLTEMNVHVSEHFLGTNAPSSAEKQTAQRTAPDPNPHQSTLAPPLPHQQDMFVFSNPWGGDGADGD